jgi:hypothetical protein
MVYTGFLELGGREIVNAGRVTSYVATHLPNLSIAPCAECEDLYEALGHKAYTSPLVDQPEWFDPDDSDTWDFYGLYPLAFEGFEDATTTADVTEFIYDGGAVSVPRRATRSVRVSALLIGLTPAAVSKGMTWLRQALRPLTCRDGLSCNGDHLCYFVACPPLCVDAIEDSVIPTTHLPFRECETGVVIEPISQCTVNYERHLYQSTCVSGPTVTAQFDPECGAMMQVEFTIVAGVPSPFGTAVRVGSGPADGEALVGVPNLPCSPGPDGYQMLRTNYAVNPAMQDAGGWTSSDDTKWPVARGTSMVRRAGIPSAITTRTATAPSSTIGGLVDVGAWGAAIANEPALEEFVTYTASVFVSASIGFGTYVTVQPLTSDGAAVGPVLTGPTIKGLGGVWVNPYVTFTAPATTAGVRLGVVALDANGANVAAGAKAAFVDALIETSSTLPATYYDGDLPSPTSLLDYMWAATRGQSASVLNELVVAGPVLDPDCPPVPLPPRPPAIESSCLDEPAQYQRYVAHIPDDAVPTWSEAVPVIRVYSQAEPIRQMRVRFYTNPFARPMAELPPCDFCGEFIISYMPPNSTLVLDGITQTATLAQVPGLFARAGHLLYGSDGGPMVWPHLTCGTAYELMVDIVPAGPAIVFDVCLAARE